MTTVLKRRRELRKAMRVARMLAALDAAAAGPRATPDRRSHRASVGAARV